MILFAGTKTLPVALNSVMAVQVIIGTLTQCSFKIQQNDRSLVVK